MWKNISLSLAVFGLTKTIRGRLIFPDDEVHIFACLSLVYFFLFCRRLVLFMEYSRLLFHRPLLALDPGHQKSLLHSISPFLFESHNFESLQVGQNLPKTESSSSGRGQSPGQSSWWQKIRTGRKSEWVRRIAWRGGRYEIVSSWIAARGKDDMKRQRRATNELLHILTSTVVNWAI